MANEQTVLLVSPTASLAREVASSIGRVGYRVIVARSFEEAKRWWTVAPHLLVTELKLGAYNGLHLAVRAGTTQVPAIVIADSAFEQEIEMIGAVWMSVKSALTDELPAVASRLLEIAASADATFTWYGELHGRAGAHGAI
jgi:DNA-binding response OmpR family regulator